MSVAKRSKKHGRNAARCKAYRSSFRREHNKITKLNKRLRHHPNDLCAVEALKLVKAKLYGARSGSAHSGSTTK